MIICDPVLIILNNMKVLYFAWIQSKTNIAEERINNNSVKDINSLLKHLSTKYPKLKKFIKQKNTIRIAVNFNYVTKNKKLKPKDEIALFPPVSGG